MLVAESLKTLGSVAQSPRVKDPTCEQEYVIRIDAEHEHLGVEVP